MTIGSEMKTIRSMAFASCPELSDVYCYAENVPETDNNVFEYSTFLYGTLHVPANSMNAYKTTDPWKSFKSIVSL